MNYIQLKRERERERDFIIWSQFKMMEYDILMSQNATTVELYYQFERSKIDKIKCFFHCISLIDIISAISSSFRFCIPVFI